MSYNGFYTAQEEADVRASQITNPNRVGSGFINLGPQQRFQQAAPNWQTGNLVGGGASAPHQVAEIWGSAPPKAPPQRPPPQKMPAPPQAFSQGGQAFAPPQQDPTAGLFNTFSIDGQGQAAAPFIKGRPNVPPPAGVSQPFMNGGVAPPPPSSLMTMINQQSAPAPPRAAAFPLGNGSVPSSRVQAPFQTHQQGNAFSQPPPQANAFSSAPRPAPQPAPAKKLSSAADYQAAAQSWKPPPRATQGASGGGHSVSRKAESQSTTASSGRQGSGGDGGAPARLEEWSCTRCTFLNNGSLWECEMCGFERPGKSEQQAAAVAAVASARAGSAVPQDSGWQTASQQRRGNQPSAAGAAEQPTGKSKAQSKNEKRRAKKRGDGGDF
jgi:hypothetical protein